MNVQRKETVGGILCESVDDVQKVIKAFLDGKLPAFGMELVGKTRPGQAMALRTISQIDVRTSAERTLKDIARHMKEGESFHVNDLAGPLGFLTFQGEALGTPGHYSLYVSARAPENSMAIQFEEEITQRLEMQLGLKISLEVELPISEIPRRSGDSHFDPKPKVFSFNWQPLLEAVPDLTDLEIDGHDLGRAFISRASQSTPHAPRLLLRSSSPFCLFAEFEGYDQRKRHDFYVQDGAIIFAAAKDRPLDNPGELLFSFCSGLGQYNLHHLPSFGADTHAAMRTAAEQLEEALKALSHWCHPLTA